MPEKLSKYCVLVLMIVLSGITSKVMSQRYVSRVFDEQESVRDVTYASGETYLGIDRELQFDFHAPEGDTLSYRPLVITVFGGSFLVGNRRWIDMQAYADSLTAYGYTVASVDYRLGYNPVSGESLIRAAYRASQDVNAAIRYFKARYETYGIDTNQIYLLGNSAGSIASLTAAFLDDEERPAETYADHIHPDLQCIDCNGDHQHLTSDVAGVISHWGGLTEMHFIDRWNQTPVCFIHGMDDSTVPYDIGPAYNIDLLPVLYGSEYLSARLDSLDIYNELHLFEEDDHCFYLEKSQLRLKPDEFTQCLHITIDFLARMNPAVKHPALLPGAACIDDKKELSLHPELLLIPEKSDKADLYRILSPEALVLSEGKLAVVQDAIRIDHLAPGVYMLVLYDDQQRHYLPFTR